MGYCFSLGSGMISWSSRRQRTPTISSCEAEYIALSESTRELLWLSSLLNELHLHLSTIPSILCDNDGSRRIANDPVHHSRTKHIDIRHHFVRQAIEDQKLTTSRVDTHHNTADILTKPLGYTPFLKLRHYLGLS